MKQKILLISVLSLIACYGLSYSSGDVIVAGNVKSFDENFVTVESASAQYRIPRKSIKLSEIKKDQPLSINLSKEEFKHIETTNLTK